MSAKSRNGIRKLNCSLNRRCWRYATKMLGGARRPNYLAVACSALNQYLRIAKRMAKEDPHLFGPHARQYFLDTLAMQREEQESQAALQRVYGSDGSAFVSTIWADRYHYKPEERRLFFKWFHEKYR